MRTHDNLAPMRANDTKTHVPSASSSSDYLNADRGNLLICGFWEGLTDAFVDVRVTTLDSKTIGTCHPRRLWNDKRKRKKYCKSCENQRRRFTPFVVSTSGLLIVRCRSQNIFKFACRRMGQALSNRKGCCQWSDEYRSS